jgi:hypothetical protein
MHTVVGSLGQGYPRPRPARRYTLSGPAASARRRHSGRQPGQQTAAAEHVLYWSAAIRDVVRQPVTPAFKIVLTKNILLDKFSVWTCRGARLRRYSRPRGSPGPASDDGRTCA